MASDHARKARSTRLLLLLLPRLLDRQAHRQNGQMFWRTRVVPFKWTIPLPSARHPLLASPVVKGEPSSGCNSPVYPLVQLSWPVPDATSTFPRQPLPKRRRLRRISSFFLDSCPSTMKSYCPIDKKLSESQPLLYMCREALLPRRPLDRRAH